MDYQGALDYIMSFTDYEKAPAVAYSAENFDLERMGQLLARLGEPHLAAKTVHIAGTKGKGSTAAMIASVLKEAGFRTGLYTSPHLHSFCERIRLDGELIPEEGVASLVERMRPAVEEVNALGTWGMLTTFEIITALAFSHFRDWGADFQVVEVGLGGRLDATNLVRPRVCVITSISYDHTAILGDTLAKIAAEKAGIIKEGCPVVMAPQTEEAAGVIEAVCQRRGAALVRVGNEVSWEGIEAGPSGQSFIVEGRLGRYQLSIPLLGDHQLDNAATAVAALELLKEQGFAIGREALRRGLEKVSWPGRLQVMGRRPWLVVDGAHNGDSMRRLREALLKYFGFDGAIFVVGISSGKKVEAIAKELAPLKPMVIATRSRHPRALQPGTVATEFARLGLTPELSESTEEALERARELAGPEDLICVTGSLFVVAEAMEVAQRVGTA